MSQDIVNYDEILAKLAKKATAVEKPSTSTITAKAGVLAYNGTPVPGNKLDCIIIASTHANLFYEDKYDPNNIKNPVCYAYSEDPDVTPMVPHPKSSKKQAETCEECWANQWESDLGGGRGKACKNIRKLAILPRDVTAEDIPNAEVASLSLPVTTVNKKWSPYVHKLATLFSRPPLAMYTQIGTMPDVKTQFMITFDDRGPVDNGLLGALMAKAESASALLEREYEANKEPTPEELEAAAEAAAKKGARGKKF